jgi:hypothetical protein
MATRQTNSSFTAQTLVAVWGKGRAVSGYDPNQYRVDRYGSWMAWAEYGQTTNYGWEVDHIVPVSKGGSDYLSNLQPLHWAHNRSKSDK